MGTSKSVHLICAFEDAVAFAGLYFHKYHLDLCAHCIVLPATMKENQNYIRFRA